MHRRTFLSDDDRRLLPCCRPLFQPYKQLAGLGGPFEVAALLSLWQGVVTSEKLGYDTITGQYKR